MNEPESVRPESSDEERKAEHHHTRLLQNVSEW